MMTTKKVGKEVERNIQRAVDEGAIKFAPTDLIELYEEECGALLNALGLDGNDCFVSDESTLYDFNGCCDDEIDRDTQAWEVWVLEKLWVRFGVRAELNDTLARICSKIKARAMSLGRFN